LYWLRRELLRRGQEALFVGLNFVFFTDSVWELYGQRMYLLFFTSTTFLEYGTIKWRSFNCYLLIWKQEEFSNLSAVKASVLNRFGAFAQCQRDSGGVWEEAGANYRGPAIRKEAWGPTKLYMFFFVFFGSIVVCRLCKITLSDQVQVTVKLGISLSDLV
jgi:hypothetical protein